MATETYFSITDGSSTCTFADGVAGETNFKLAYDSWAPAVAGPRRSELGGRGPYDDVVEDMEFVVSGSTAAHCLGNLAALERLLTQAERWASGENVSPVLVKYSPKGATVSSAASPLQAVIMGRVPGDDNSIRLPATFEGPILSRGKYIFNARLRFVRRGAWLAASTDDSTGGSAANPGVFTVTGLASHPHPSPVKVKIAGMAFGTAFDFADSLPIVLLAAQVSDLQIAEAETGTATGFTSVADTGNVARGGSHLRYTPTGTSEATSGEIGLSSMTNTARRFAFYAALRNNSGSTTWRLRVGALVEGRAATSTNTIAAYTRSVLIDTAHTRPRFVPLGIVTLPAALKSIQFLITASAASGTLDIDYLVALAVDNPYARAIQLQKLENTGALLHAQSIDLIVDPQPLTSLAPAVYRTFQATSDVDWLGYYGDAFPVTVAGSLAGALMAKRANAPSCWTYAAASGTADALTMSAYRYTAYSVPE